LDLLSYLYFAVDILWRVLLKQFPYSTEICIFCYTLYIGVRLRKQLESNFWFHSLVLYFFGAFGGGTIVPTILGKPPVYMANDFVGICGIISWYLTQYCPGDLVNKCFSLAIPKFVLTSVAAIFLGNLLVDNVQLAHTIFKPSKYYPIPIFGPIICGCLCVSAAQFFPLNRGLDAIKKGVPFNIQSAFVCSTFYHLSINDPGPMGQFLRTNLVSPNISAVMARWMVVAFFLSTSIIQNNVDENFNPFKAVHRVAYAFTKLPKKNDEDENIFHKIEEVVFDVLEILGILTLILSFTIMQHPPALLNSGVRLNSGKYLASCAALTSFRKCQPYVLSMESDGVLRLFKAVSPLEEKKDLIWSSTTPKISSDAYYAFVDPNTAVLSIKTNGTDRVVWSTPMKNKVVSDLAKDAKLYLQQGYFQVRTDESIFWSSETQ